MSTSLSSQLTTLGVTYTLIKHDPVANLADYIKRLQQDGVIALKTVYLSTAHLVLSDASVQYSLASLPKVLGVKKVRIGDVQQLGFTSTLDLHPYYYFYFKYRF